MQNRNSLSVVMVEYLNSRRLVVAESTVLADSKTLRQFLAVVGDIQVRSIEARHVDRFLAARRQEVAASTLNVQMGNLGAFFKWCRERRFMPANSNPMGTRRRLKEMPRKRLYVPRAEFPRLLDAAKDPRDRIIVAVGLYIFTRASETRAITVGDAMLNLPKPKIWVTRKKTSERVKLPICLELDGELRRWLTYYSSTAVVRPDSVLVPARYAPMIVNGSDRNRPRPDMEFRTDTAPRRLDVLIRPILGLLGYPTEQEGGHTLRRSGARAMYDHLAHKGHDRAVRKVQWMLGHKKQDMTERYLGLDTEEKEVDDLLAGQYMFDQPDENVVQLPKQEALVAL